MRCFEKCLHCYIGCETSEGQLVGYDRGSLLIQKNGEDAIVRYDVALLGSRVFLYLRQLSDLTDEQSRELIEKGIAIGRPNGYTFSNAGFLYLLSLNVDLFGLVKSGYAKNSSERSINKQG